MGEDHTYRHFRRHWYPTVIDRGNYESWIEKGSKTLGQRVNEKVKSILETHTPEALAQDVACICLENPPIQRVDVTVDKPGALRFARSVAVEIVREREAGS